MVLLAIEFKPFTQLGFAGQSLDVCWIGEGLAIEGTAVDGCRDPGLFEGVLRFSAAEWDVGANNAFLVLENHREVLEEVGQAAHFKVAAVLIGEDDVANPAGGQAIAIHHRTHAEQTTFGRAVADVVVEGQLFRDRGIGLLHRSPAIEGRLDAAIDFGLEVALVPLVAGGAKQFDRGGCSAVPHGSCHHEGRKEDGRNGRGQNRFDVAHAQRFVEALGGAGGDVEDAGNDANDACGDVVGNDPARIEGVKPLRAPGRLYRLEVPV